MHLDITFTMHMSTQLLDIYLVPEIYYKRDVLKIPRANPSLTNAPGEYNYIVYPDRMTRMVNKSLKALL